MDGLKWGMDNPEVKKLPFNDEEQTNDPNNIVWQNGFDYRFHGDEETKFPTKENFDDMLSFLAAKYFFLKCGGLNFNNDPSTMALNGDLPTVIRSQVGNVWNYIGPSIASFYEDSNNGIGLKDESLSRTFFNPSNNANLHEGTIQEYYLMTVLGSPANGVCGSLGLGDVIYFPEYNPYPVSAKSNMMFQFLKERAIATENPNTADYPKPDGFDDFPNFFVVSEKPFDSTTPSESNLADIFPVGASYKVLSQKNAYNSRLVSEVFIMDIGDDFPGPSYEVGEDYYKHACFKANTDIVLLFDFQPFLNVLKYTSAGENPDAIVATFNNGCVNLVNGYYHDIFIGISDKVDSTCVSPSYNPPIGDTSIKPVLLASGGQLVCDRIFLRRGSCFNFFINTNAPVDFRFQATAISIAKDS